MSVGRLSAAVGRLRVQVGGLRVQVALLREQVGRHNLRFHRLFRLTMSLGAETARLLTRRGRQWDRSKFRVNKAASNSSLVIDGDQP